VPDKSLTFILAGGGTGGHLFPALAIAEELQKQKPEARLLFVGTKGKIEMRIVPERGYPIRTLWLSGVRRSLSPGNILVPFKIAVSLLQSFALLREVRPAAVIGTGGYVCGPILYTASLLGIPTVIHESNSYPGITTRLLARRVSLLLAAFEDIRRWLPSGRNIEVVGTPTLGSLEHASREEGRSFFGLEPGRKTVLVIGGSQGAASINAAILRMAKQLQQSGIQYIWQTGAREADALKAQAGSPAQGWIGAFINRMDLAYAAADVVVCRAGATTIAELTRIGKPAILVPYPHAAEDHQTRNARTLVDAGAARMIPDSEVGTRLERELLELLENSAVQNAMIAAARRLGNPNAARRVAERILQLTGK